MFEFRGEVISYLKSHDNLHKEHTKRFDALESKMDSKFAQVDSRFAQLEAKFDSKFAEMDSKFEQLEAKFDSRFAQVDLKFAQLEAKFDSKFDRMMSEMHRIGLLVEEQNARNKFVLDGYTSIVDRLDKHDTEIAEIKNIIEKF